MTYTYNVYPEASNKVFDDACAKIEDCIPNLVKSKVLIDVDGSVIQKYSQDNEVIKVFNDIEVDAVYVDSDIDLSSVFT